MKHKKWRETKKQCGTGILPVKPGGNKRTDKNPDKTGWKPVRLFTQLPPAALGGFPFGRQHFDPVLDICQLAVEIAAWPGFS